MGPMSMPNIFMLNARLPVLEDGLPLHVGVGEGVLPPVLLHGERLLALQGLLVVILVHPEIQIISH